ncbi:hypothetical protein AABB24_005344, partial [Solanum stoloniferum]
SIKKIMYKRTYLFKRNRIKLRDSNFEPNDDILDFVIKKANGLKGLVDTSRRGRCPCKNFGVPSTPLQPPTRYGGDCIGFATSTSASVHDILCRVSGRVLGKHQRSNSRTAHE